MVVCVCGGRGLSNADHHDWPTQKKLKLRWLKRPETVPKKQNLDPKINDSKPHIASLFFISDFLAESLKANKN